MIQTERGHSRIALRRAVRLECQAVRTRDFRLLGTRAIDLSPFGMRLLIRDRSGLSLGLGDEVLVTFRAPGSHRWIDCAARVTGLFDGSIGLQFGQMDDASRATLEKTLRGLPPPIPGRIPSPSPSLSLTTLGSTSLGGAS
jgi:hypothetical protein